MGTYLSTPVTEKTEMRGDDFNSKKSSPSLSWGVVDMQGWRKSMEDAHIACTDVAVSNSCATSDGKAKVFGVFDGHGGPEVARFCEIHLVDVLISQDKWKAHDIGGALTDAFHVIDTMIEDPSHRKDLHDLRTAKQFAKENKKIENGTHSAVTNLQDLKTGNQQCEKEAAEVEVSEKDENNDLTTGSINGTAENLPPPSGPQDKEGLPMTSTSESSHASDPEAGNKDGDGTSDAISTSDAMEIFNKLLSIRGARASAEAGIDEDSDLSNNENPVTEQSTENSSSKIGVSKDDSAISVDKSINNAGVVSHSPTFHNGRKVCNLPDHAIHAGCTSIVAVLIDRTLTVANAGDSRAVLCRAGGKTEPLSFDHKPLQEREMERITKAGGFVNQFGRVNGNLNLSRSIGDLKYKQHSGLPPCAQMITAEPDILQVTLEPEDEFIFIGCDGIFDCLSNEEAVKYVFDRIDSKLPTEIATEMLDDIISVDPRTTQGIGGDNMTCMIVDLLPHRRKVRGIEPQTWCDY